VITLAIDASTYLGTCAVFENGMLVAEGETAMRGKDAERLFPMVLDTLRTAGLELREVGEIACGAGPGSFTSLRITASLAKGIAMGLGISIRPVPSLGLVAAAAAPSREARRYLAALDALRGEFYVQPFTAERDQLVPLADHSISAAADLEGMAARLEAQLIGPHIGGSPPHARGAQRLPKLPFVDLGSWEPDYGRKAEAQARWEAAHGRPLAV
jgi:tRNA threonylcarbamoyladenosine biosynthesis protein TsaB